MEINHSIISKEAVNLENIYIYFSEEGSVAYDASALRLKHFFPWMPINSVVCTDNKEHLLIKIDVPLEEILVAFKSFSQLVDDECICVLNVLS